MFPMEEKLYEIYSNKTDNFLELVSISELDIELDFRFANFEGMNFSNCDLRGFDFTGSDFTKANIENARFELGIPFAQAVTISGGTA